MTIEEKAKEYVARHADSIALELREKITEDAFRAGAAWMRTNDKLLCEKLTVDTKKEVINKAVEWLKENVAIYTFSGNYNYEIDYYTEDCVNDFKEAMEE